MRYSEHWHRHRHRLVFYMQTYKYHWHQDIILSARGWTFAVFFDNTYYFANLFQLVLIVTCNILQCIVINFKNYEIVWIYNWMCVLQNLILYMAEGLLWHVFLYLINDLPVCPTKNCWNCHKHQYHHLLLHGLGIADLFHLLEEFTDPSREEVQGVPKLISSQQLMWQWGQEAVG